MTKLLPTKTKQGISYLIGEIGYVAGGEREIERSRGKQQVHKSGHFRSPGVQHVDNCVIVSVKYDVVLAP